MKRSTKEVRPLKELLAERLFILPKHMANQLDPHTGESVIFVGVNGVNYFITVEKPSPIPYVAFCALKDMGILEYYKSYDDGMEVV